MNIKTILYLGLFLSLFFYSCEKNDNVIDSNFYQSPTITLLNLSPKNINIDKLNIKSPMLPTDTVHIDISTAISSESELSKIYFEIKSEIQTTSIFSGLVNNVEIASNNLTTISKSYKGNLSFISLRKDIGKYQLLLYAFDNNYTRSNFLITNFTIQNEGNHLPAITNIIAPDSILVENQTYIFTISAVVSDSDGISDINKVQFSVYKPDGSPPSASLQMYDDGDLKQHGDQKSGDGTYSLIVQISASNMKGKYKFEFQAIDKSNAYSNIKTHYLTVK